ncbi:MAG: EF-hand domain-containing protein, partial [Luteolibacter sp.]
MKNYLKVLGVTILATTLSYGEEAPEKPEKPKAPNPEKMFKKLDTDGNGSLSLEEFKASPRGQKDPAKAEEAYKKMDADSKDGVSLEEFKAAAPAPGKGKKKEDAAG